MAHRIAEKHVTRAPLRVLHRGMAMVPDYRALADTGTRRFHGLTLDPTLGPEDDFLHPVTGETFRAHHGGFVKNVDVPHTIAPDDPHYAEYLRHLKDGDLWAADAATAAAAGVPFEFDFGGEHPKTAKGDEASEHRKRDAERQKKSLEAIQSAAKPAPADEPTVSPETGT